ncbi:MAG: hypothetical protein IKK43_01015 [Clostridia bacterium]|nr:hypothetical protein [Clostridia bacterium]
MYIIDRTNLKKEKKFFMMFFWVGLLFSLLMNGLIIGEFLGLEINSEGSPVFGLIVSNLVTGLFMWVGLSNAKKVKQKHVVYDNLEVNGKLIKDLPYKLVPTGSSVNGYEIMAITVEYQLDSGSIVTLRGDGRFDGKHMDADGKVDLLIDPSNPSNYYIDFEISEYCNEYYGNNPIQ